MRASEQPPQRQGALPNAHCHLGSCGHLLGGLRALAEAVLEAARHGLEVAHAASALGPAAHGLVLLGVAPHLGGGTVGAAGADALLEVERALTAPAAKGVALRESERRQEAQKAADGAVEAVAHSQTSAVHGIHPQAPRYRKRLVAHVACSRSAPTARGEAALQRRAASGPRAPSEPATKRAGGGFTHLVVTGTLRGSTLGLRVKFRVTGERGGGREPGGLRCRAGPSPRAPARGERTAPPRHRHGNDVSGTSMMQPCRLTMANEAASEGRGCSRRDYRDDVAGEKASIDQSPTHSSPAEPPPAVKNGR